MKNNAFSNLINKQGRHWPILFFLFLLLLTEYVYFFPVFKTHRQLLLTHWDESWYSARAIRAYQGDLWPNNPFIKEEKDNPTIVPPLGEVVIGQGLHLINWFTSKITSFDSLMLYTIIIWKIVALSFLFFLFYLVAISLGIGSFASSTLSFIILTTPYLKQLRPHFLMPYSADSFALIRFINPSFNLIIFLSCMLFALKAFKQKKTGPRVKYSLLAGLFLGASFYTSFYYWSHLIMAITLLTLFLLWSRKEEIKTTLQVFLTGVLTTSIVALPYFIHHLKLKNTPSYNDWSWRHGLFVKIPSLYLLGQKNLWIFLAICLFLFYRHSLKIKNDNNDESLSIIFICLMALSGLGFYWSPAFFGRDVQSWHWVYSNNPLLIIILSYFMLETYKTFKLKFHVWVDKYKLQPIVLSVVVLFVVSTFLHALKVGQKQNDLEARSQDYPQQGLSLLPLSYLPLWQSRSLNFWQDKVIIAPLEVMPLVPLHTGAWVWLDNHMTADLMSFEDIFDRYLVYWKLMGLNPKQVAKTTNLVVDGKAPVWYFGLFLELKKELIQNGRPLFDGPLQVQLSKKIEEYYQNVSDQKIGHILQDKALDYLAIDCHFDLLNFKKFYHLKLEVQNKGLCLYHLTPTSP